MRLLTEHATCPTCGRTVTVYCPRHGDGSARVTYWHKRRPRGPWCRAEVDDWHTEAAGPDDTGA